MLFPVSISSILTDLHRSRLWATLKDVLIGKLRRLPKMHEVPRISVDALVVRVPAAQLLERQAVALSTVTRRVEEG